MKKPRPKTRNPDLGCHPDKPKLQVSKLEIAKREIETCSDLYFDLGDLVSMHVLINAAHEILSVYDTKILKTGMVIDGIKHAVRPERIEEFRELLKRPYSGFKHGQKDLSAVVELPDGLTEILMVSAIQKYGEITGNLTPKMKILHIWLGVHHRIFTPVAERHLKADWIRKYFPVTARPEFRNEFLPPLLEAQSSVDWTKIFGGT